MADIADELENVAVSLVDQFCNNSFEIPSTMGQFLWACIQRLSVFYDLRLLTARLGYCQQCFQLKVI